MPPAQTLAQYSKNIYHQNICPGFVFVTVYAVPKLFTEKNISASGHSGFDPNMSNSNFTFTKKIHFHVICTHYGV